MAWDDNLEGVAYDIAKTDSSPLRVVAGPGTGKSYAMKRRVARLLEVDGADPKRILAVTFTRNAAQSLVDDLHDLGIPGCQEINARTLHSYCFGLLSRQGVFGETGRTPRPLMTFMSSAVARFEAAPLLADIARSGDFGGARACTSRIRAFEADWARLQSDQPGWPIDEIDKQFHSMLVSWLKFHKAMLVGELVPEALRYLRNNPHAAARTDYDHVIVDEYQDLNRAEQELVQLLSERSSGLAVVGDADQSIYRFRHANPEGMEDFSNINQGTHDEELVDCRRCPQKVVAMADHLIRNNHPGSNVVRLSPFANNPEGEVHSVQWGSLESESTGLAQYVTALVESGRAKPEEIMILSPRKRIGYAIRDALRARDVPVHSFYNEEYLEPEQAQEAMCLLTLMCDKDDAVAMRWWLGQGSASWRARDYSYLRSYCEENSMSPRECLEKLSSNEISIPFTKGLVSRYDMLRARLDELAQLGVSDLLDRLFPVDEEWAEGLRGMAIDSVDDEATAATILEGVRKSITQPEAPDEADYVRVMSVHKSKGLTSKVVIVAGCVNGIFPSVLQDVSQAEGEAHLLEQRRLFYVAVTRCRELLVLSSVASIPTNIAYAMGVQAQGSRGLASQFLGELGPACPVAVRGEDWLQEAI